jgi:hypothetical protein
MIVRIFIVSLSFVSPDRTARAVRVGDAAAVKPSLDRGKAG